MYFLNKMSLFLLCLGLMFTACEKENVDDVIVGQGPDYEVAIVEVNNLVNALQTVLTNEGLELGCITINYPFDLLTTSGETITVNDDVEFDLAMMEEGELQLVDFVFPLSITDEEGNTSDVNDNETLGIAFASCFPDDNWDDAAESDDLLPAFLFEGLCFDLAYPANLENEEGITFIANNEAEFIDLSATEENLFFSLPLDITNNDGTIITIENLNTFYNIVFNCNGVSPPVVSGEFIIQGFGCNSLVFPFDVITEEGVLVTVNDENEYADLVLNGAEILLQYPFSLVNEEEEVTEINTGDDLIAALNACGGFYIEITPTDLCSTPAHVQLFFNAHNIFTVFSCPFSINYPVEMTVEGTSNTLNDLDDYFVVSGAPNSINSGIVLGYPIAVTEQDGTIVTLNSDEEICVYISACE